VLLIGLKQPALEAVLQERVRPEHYLIDLVNLQTANSCAATTKASAGVIELTSGAAVGLLTRCG
jgi:hypothetical protein